MYRVVKFFRDLKDHNHAYHVGDEFPHSGKAVSEERLLELSTDANKRHEPLIKKVDVEPVELDESKEPAEDFMNPPEKAEEKPVESPKPRKRRGRPRNDAE